MNNIIEELDVHGDSINVAIRKIQRFIVQLKIKKVYYFEVIHGYNKGIAIKKFISNKFNIHSSLIDKVYPTPFNLGRTSIKLKIGI